VDGFRSHGVALSDAGVDAETAVTVVNEVLTTTQTNPPTADAETELDSLGLDSLDFAELFVALEEISGGEIDPRSTVGIATVGDLIRLRRL